MKEREKKNARSQEKFFFSYFVCLWKSTFFVLLFSIRKEGSVKPEVKVLM